MRARPNLVYRPETLAAATNQQTEEIAYSNVLLHVPDGVHESVTLSVFTNLKGLDDKD